MHSIMQHSVILSLRYVILNEVKDLSLELRVDSESAAADSE